MKQIKLTIDSKEITAQISDEDYKTVAPSKSGRWKPDNGGKYWSVPSGGGVVRGTWRSDVADEFLYSQRNVFKTKEAAEHHLKLLKAKAAILDHADKVNEGWKPTWSDNRYYLGFHHYDRELKSYCHEWMQPTTIAYYKSNEAAEAAIKAVGNEYKLIMGIE